MMQRRKALFFILTTPQVNTHIIYKQALFRIIHHSMTDQKESSDRPNSSVRAPDDFASRGVGCQAPL